MEGQILTLYFEAIILGLAILYASGQPSITYTVKPLSDEPCLITVTFSCNWLDTLSSVIEFYSDDTRLVRYLYEVDHTFPRSITPVPSGFMAQISSADLSSVNNELSYLNFTISILLDDLKSYQGQDISCGTVTVRSNVIPIDKDLIPFPSERFNIRSTVVYINLELKLSEIIVFWDDLMFSDNCLQNISYIVELTNQETRQNGRYNCNNMTCSTTFQLGNGRRESDNFTISVIASSETQNFSSGQISLNTALVNVFTIRNGTNCEQNFVCLSNNNCSIQYRESESSPFESLEVNQEGPMNFSPGKRVYLNITATSIDSNVTFMAQINFIADNPQRNYNDYVGVGVTLMILGFIIEIVGSAVIVINSRKKSSVSPKVLVCIHCVSWLLVILSLSLWISHGVVNDPGSCTSEPEENIAIVATVMSILLAIISVVITGALVLKCLCQKGKSLPIVKKDTNSDKEKLVFKVGIEFEPRRKSSICTNSDCSKTLRWWNITEPCQSCGLKICGDCPKHVAYIATLKKKNGRVCNMCYKTYLEENENIAKARSVGYIIQNLIEFQALIDCKMCASPRTTECLSCKRQVCSQHSIIKLDISIGKENVCKFCYMLHIRRYEEHKQQNKGNNFIYDFSAEIGEGATPSTSSSTDVTKQSRDQYTSNATNTGTDAEISTPRDSTMTPGAASTKCTQSSSKDKDNVSKEDQQTEQNVTAAPAKLSNIV